MEQSFQHMWSGIQFTPYTLLSSGISFKQSQLKFHVETWSLFIMQKIPVFQFRQSLQLYYIQFSTFVSVYFSIGWHSGHQKMLR